MATTLTTGTGQAPTASGPSNPPGAAQRSPAQLARRLASAGSGC